MFNYSKVEPGLYLMLLIHHNSYQPNHLFFYRSFYGNTCLVLLWYDMFGLIHIWCLRSGGAVFFTYRLRSEVSPVINVIWILITTARNTWLELQLNRSLKFRSHDILLLPTLLLPTIFHWLILGRIWYLSSSVTCPKYWSFRIWMFNSNSLSFYMLLSISLRRM